MKLGRGEKCNVNIQEKNNKNNRNGVKQNQLFGMHTHASVWMRACAYAGQGLCLSSNWLIQDFVIWIGLLTSAIIIPVMMCSWGACTAWRSAGSGGSANTTGASAITTTTMSSWIRTSARLTTTRTVRIRVMRSTNISHVTGGAFVAGASWLHTSCTRISILSLRVSLFGLNNENHLNCWTSNDGTLWWRQNCLLKNYIRPSKIAYHTA